ncbi:MAG: flavin reductase family protein [Clostridia bacterium]|mgnify:CR=1 FL=1|nr:flavin reductase family protein [Clostridia bacterium]
MKNVGYNEYLKEVLEQLPKGAFLTVKNGEQLNTMTIGWGTVGYIWKMPVFMVLVRHSRHTYRLLEEAKEFTISIPLKNDFKKELALCGTKSGRDMDKIKEAKLNLLPAQTMETPIIDGCGRYFECKVVYQQSMEPSLLIPEIKGTAYKQGDYHVLYYGEIKASYINEDYI